MTNIDFWTVFGAVLGANLLTVAFVWGLREYSRHEQAGTEGSRDSFTPLIGILLPMGFLTLTLYVLFFER